jgi:hypothetical protein
MGSGQGRVEAGLAEALVAMTDRADIPENRGSGIFIGDGDGGKREENRENTRWPGRG